MRKIFAATAAIALFALGAAYAQGEGPQVTIDSGTLSGASDDGIDVFKAIPYAAPPVGDLRWEPPAPATKWIDKRDATKFGAICPQPRRPDGVTAAGGDSVQSEDCLFLNVWAPAGAERAGKKLPVMVWIHGGAHRFGSGQSPIYNGAPFAHDGIVLVTLNYRLGLLGYFAHPALTKAAAPDAPLGNYGGMDQLAALRWVQRNIASFGGDPANVTVFGESAGGASILWLMAAPASHGLFAKAIVESGGGWEVPTTLTKKEADGVAFASSAGLPNATLAQLRAIPVDKTFGIPAMLGFGPFVDGRLFKETPSQAFADGSAVDVPLIIGSNSFEASLMKSFGIPPAAMIARLGPEARKVYAADASDDVHLAYAVFTDAVMGAPAHWVAGKASGGAPAWLYHFSYVAAMRRASVPGASHGSEIPYVFGTGSALAERFGIHLGDEDRAMEKLVHSCWVGFAKTGAPTAASGCAAWPAFTPASDTLMEFGPTPGPVSHFREAQYRADAAVALPTLQLKH